MSGVGRISTYTMHQSLLRDTTRSQVDLYDLQNQLSSGLKSSNFAGLGGDIEKFIDLDSRLGRTNTYIDTNQIADGRLAATDNVLGQVIDMATNIKLLIGQRRQAAIGDDIAYQTQIEGQWKSLVAIMNSTSEGNYIFSGTKTNTAPVNATDFPVLLEDGTPDANYYQGNSEDQTIRIDDNIAITPNIRANDPAFQKIFAGIAMAMKYGNVESGDSPEMKQAYDFIESGVEGVTTLRTTVLANKVTVMDNKDRLTSMQLYWKGLKEEISNTDIVSVSTEVAINQGILQAAFQTFAKISSLKLSDFL